MDALGQALKTRFSLEGQRGIVTGGAGGLGRVMARTLAQADATVFSFDLSTPCSPEGGEWAARIIDVEVNICDETSVRKEIHAIGEAGLDFLINNAGITSKEPAAELPLSTFRKIQNVNVDGLYSLCQAAYPYLKKAPRGGRIVSISSMAAHLGFTGVVPYCASKAAVTGITRGLAVEWADDNILVNSVAPGWFPSQMNRQVVDPQREKLILSRMPLHRYGEPEELANMVLFLVSPAASYITGQDFAVDGGALAFGY